MEIFTLTHCLIVKKMMVARVLHNQAELATKLIIRFIQSNGTLYQPLSLLKFILNQLLRFVGLKLHKKAQLKNYLE